MNAQILYSLKDGIYKDSGVFFCSNCRIVHTKLDWAEKCCKCIYCDKLVEEKKPNQSGSYIYHDKCWEVKRLINSKKTEEERFAKATKITAKEWAKNEHSWIFSESYSSNEGYCDINDFLDDFIDNYSDFYCLECGEGVKAFTSTNSDILSRLECKCGWRSPDYEVVEDIVHLFLPKYVWAAEFEPVELDFYSIIERAEEDHYDGCEANGTEELKAAIDKFNEDNKKNGSYNVNYKIAITNLEELL